MASTTTSIRARARAPAPKDASRQFNKIAHTHSTLMQGSCKATHSTLMQGCDIPTHSTLMPNQKNYYADVNIQDQIAELQCLLGLSRDDTGARLTENMLPYQHGIGIACNPCSKTG